MPLKVHVPIFSDLAPGGFKTSANYLVEFDANSIVWSASFYKQFEAQCDGVIDFKTAEEDEGQLENHANPATR